jgi:hypothetical protein
MSAACRLKISPDAVRETPRFSRGSSAVLKHPHIVTKGGLGDIEPARRCRQVPAVAIAWK